MTQYFIRKGAGIGWLKRGYMRLHEPRNLSAAYGAAYLLIAVIWTRAIFVQPQTFEGPWGPAVIGIIGAVTATGALASLVTVLNGAYWAERSTAGIIIAGFLAYLALTLYLELTGTGNRQPGALSTVLAIGFLGLRYYWILDRTHSPEKQIVD